MRTGLSSPRELIVYANSVAWEGIDIVNTGDDNAIEKWERSLNPMFKKKVGEAGQAITDRMKDLALQIERGQQVDQSLRAMVERYLGETLP